MVVYSVGPGAKHNTLRWRAWEPITGTGSAVSKEVVPVLTFVQCVQNSNTTGDQTGSKRNGGVEYVSIGPCAGSNTVLLNILPVSY